MRSTFVAVDGSIRCSAPLSPLVTLVYGDGVLVDLAVADVYNFTVVPNG